MTSHARPTPVALTRDLLLRDELDRCTRQARTTAQYPASVPTARRAGRHRPLIIVGVDLATRPRTPLHPGEDGTVIAAVSAPPSAHPDRLDAAIQRLRASYGLYLPQASDHITHLFDELLRQHPGSTAGALGGGDR